MHQLLSRRRKLREVSKEDPDLIEEETVISKKEPKLDKSKTARWKTVQEENIRALKITFEFGPLELNTYQYVFDGLKDIWKLLGLRNEPDESFVLLAEVGQDVKKLCLDLFSSIPTFTEIPIRNLELQKDQLQPKPLIVSLEQDTILQKETRDLIKRAVGDEAKYLFFVADENLPMENLAESGFNLEDVNILYKGKKSHDHFYEICNEIASDKVSKYLLKLSTKRSTRSNSFCLKLLRKYKNEMEMSTNPSSLDEEVVKKVDKAVKKASKKFPVLGYALYEGALRLFAGSEIRLLASDLVQNVRSFLDGTFHGRIFAQLLRKPYFIPFSSIQGGCELTNGSFSGTLGMFANWSTEKGLKIIAISSGHVATNGNEVMAKLGGGMKLLGHCIWPEAEGNNAMNANLKDISVIILNSETAWKIRYRFPDFDVKLPRRELVAYKNRKVFKFGAKTNKTYGSLKCAKSSKLMKAEVMFIEPRYGIPRFSEPGDSGAIVFTMDGESLIALGVVFGGDYTSYTSYESDEENTEDFDDAHCIAIDFSKAINLFEAAKKGNLTLEKF